MEDQSQFPVEIAENIVEMLHQVTGQNVNFMGEGGVIIATMQPERVGQVHEGARRIMSREIDELAISMEDAKKLQGTLPGYNGVVIYKGKRMGCIGLSGDPEKMRPLQQLATIIVREEFEKFQTTNRKREVLENVIGEIGEISSAIQEISAGSENVFQQSKEIEDMTNHAENSIESINKVITTVKQIADETTLLGFNAAIEAVHAGQFGKGYSLRFGKFI